MVDRTSNRKEAAKDTRKPARKVPRRITKDRLRNIALYHLERFATSAENLRRVLYRRTLKASRHYDTDMEQAKAWIDEVVDGLVRSTAIDDTRYADGKTLTMLRRGQSPLKIRAYLASKGIATSTINAALEHATAEFGDPDLEAARAYATRRRLGPFRIKEITSELKQKELAVLGRAGFKFDIARKVVEAETEDDLM
ncbi:MAG: regulatory protein RecX [Rhodospirillaceae bacterium]|nr:regulatory protein RecX [Rhodospirillaceae bacterium]